MDEGSKNGLASCADHPIDSTIPLSQAQHTVDRPWGINSNALNWCIYDEIQDFQKN
jgi:hypothetical protein